MQCQNSQICTSSYIKHLSVQQFETNLNPDQKFISLLFNFSSEDGAFKEIDKAVLKEAYSGLVTLVIEAAKHDVDASTMRLVFLSNEHCLGTIICTYM